MLNSVIKKLTAQVELFLKNAKISIIRIAGKRRYVMDNKYHFRVSLEYDNSNL